MSLAAAPALKQNLDQRLERAVARAFRELGRIEVRRVKVSDQRRHLGRMSTCSVQVAGTGWAGCVVLMTPEELGRNFAERVTGSGPVDGRYRGADLAEGLGALSAAIALSFARDFATQGAVTVGMPLVVSGGDVAVTFPWGEDYEARHCHQSDSGPFWVILKLSQVPN